jgi:ribonuclease G
MSQNILVVNAEGSEVRVAVIEQGSLAELFVERKRERGLVGNIYRGKVTRVLPGMQAAFVDLGPKVERAAFLFVGDVLGSGDQSKLFEDADTDADTDEAPEGTAARLARSRKALANRKIEDLLRPGQEVLCQVVKDPIGQKGARVTGYLSLPGRYGVFMPAVDQVGVSKRIGSDKERKRLRDIVNSARPKGAGFIVRTAAEDAIEQEIRDDVEYLSRVWSEIGRREKELRGPGLIYADLDLALRTVRDLMREETTELLIDDEDQFERVRKFTMAFLPRFAERIKRYDNRRPIFDFYHVEPALRQAIGRKVPLRSGGSLVIDQGEALTAIDINTGSFTGKGSDLEDTVTRNNLEACDEVARQLRLRNIGGIIVVDFVDMDREENRKKVWEAFQRALKRDRARCNVTKISELGLVEMTRKRTRESLVQVLTEPCPLCEGSPASSSRRRPWPTRSCARCAARAAWPRASRSSSSARRGWPTSSTAASATTSTTSRSGSTSRSSWSARRAGGPTSTGSPAACRPTSSPPRRPRPRSRCRRHRARPAAATATATPATGVVVVPVPAPAPGGASAAAAVGAGAGATPRRPDAAGVAA